MDALDTGSTSDLRSGWRELEREHWVLLAILGATSFFEGFDKSVLVVALNQIRESFSLSQADASLWLAITYMGALPAMVVARRADVIGRKRLLLVSIVFYTLASGLTALSPNVGVFALLQFIARLFLTAEAAIVVTFAAEELPARARGFGYGFLGMMLSAGFGAGAIVYSIIEPLGLSWRYLYVLAVPPLVLISFARRRLPESRRFERAKQADRLASSSRVLLRPPHRRWLVLACLVGFLIELPTEASVFAIDFLQEARGFDASSASLALVVAGTPGIPLMVWSGNASDRFGRRIVGSAFMLLSVVGGALFFWVDAPGPVPIVFMVLLTSGAMGGWPILQGMVTELFPTALRSQATSMATGFRITGQAASLLLGGLLLHALDDNFPLTVTILSVGVVLAVVVVVFLLPDTHSAELEALTGEEAFEWDTPATAVEPLVTER